MFVFVYSFIYFILVLLYTIQFQINFITMTSALYLEHYLDSEYYLKLKFF